MDHLIFKYIAGSGELCLRGIGRFKLEQEAAEPDVSEQQMRPPKTVTRFTDEPVQEDYLLTKYIARHYVIPEEDARKKLQAYTQNIIDEADANGKAGVSTLGELQKKPADEGYNFTAQLLPVYLQPVDAVRPIRQDEVHLIRVGEDEKTNVEMAGILSETPRRKWKWWVLPLIGGTLALAYIAYHLFVQQGSVGSQQKIPVQ